MHSFESFPPDSKVWIYLADRALNEQEISWLEQKLEEFVSTWSHHGKKHKGWAGIMYDRFLVFMLDPHVTKISGCSIDDSVHFIKEAGSQLGVDFLNRFLVAFRLENEICVFHKDNLPEMLASGAITPTTIIFDHLVANKEDFVKSWEKPLEKSWLGKFLPLQST